MILIPDVLGPLLEGVPLALVPLSPCQNYLANRNKKSDPGYTKIKYFLATWFNCKLVIVSVQRKSPLVEGCSIMCVHTTSQVSVCCNNLPTSE
jgi:hypothetical protein